MERGGHEFEHGLHIKRDERRSAAKNNKCLSIFYINFKNLASKVMCDFYEGRISSIYVYNNFFYIGLVLTVSANNYIAADRLYKFTK